MSHQSRYLPRNASCISLGLKPMNMCDACKVKHDASTEGRKSRSKKLCARPWSKDMSSGLHHSQTISKHKLVLDNLSKLGYRVDCTLTQDVKSRLYKKEDRTTQLKNVQSTISALGKKNSVVPKTKIKFSPKELYGEKTIVSMESDTSSLESTEIVDSSDSESCRSEGGHNAKSPEPTNPSCSHHKTSSTAENGCCPTHHPQASSEMEKVPSPTRQHPQPTQTKKGSYQFVPESHTVVCKAWHERYKRESCKLREVKKNLTRRRYHGTKKGRRLYGAAYSIAPNFSQDKLQTVGSLFLAGALVDAGLDVDITKVQGCTPGRATMNSIVADTAVDRLLDISTKIEENPCCYIICDKANSDKAGAKSATFPKMLAFVDKTSRTINEFLLDCDATGSSTEEAAEGILHSLDKLGFKFNFVLSGQATDSGGGGTLYALKEALREKGLVAEGYRVVSCSLHNVQTCLRQCVQKVYGEGGMIEKQNGKVEYKKNAMQLLNGLYNLFTYLDVEEIKEMWRVTCEDLGVDEKFTKLTNPVVTRWWLIGVTASEVNKHWRIWERMMAGLIKMPKAKTAQGTKSTAIQDIAAANKNLMGMNEIRADVKFIAHLHDFFVFPHFEHLQKGDPLTGEVPGYQGRMMTLRYFIMYEDLRKCEQGKWQSENKFASFASFIGDNLLPEEKERCTVKANHAFRIMRSFLVKHFDPWANEHLPYCLFAPEVAVARTAANFLLGRPPLWSQGTNELTSDTCCESEFHQKRKINLREFELFLCERCSTRTTIQQQSLLTQNQTVIGRIANGENLWAQENLPEDLNLFREHYILKLSAQPTVTHMIERAVKRANNCYVQNRSEKMRSVFVTAYTETIKHGSLKKKNKKEQWVEV